MPAPAPWVGRASLALVLLVTASAGRGLAGLNIGYEVTEFPLPRPNSVPTGITTDAAGDIWFTCRAPTASAD